MALRETIRKGFRDAKDKLFHSRLFRVREEPKSAKDARYATLISREDIAKRVAELGEEISDHYAGEDLVVVCVLKGSFMFYADLVRAIHGVRVRCEFLGVKSYDGETSTGNVEFTQDLRVNIEGCHVLIVEDIVDTGRTLEFLRRALKLRKPASVRVVTFLDKPSRREVEVKVEYIGFKIENRFVVGYGLDDEQYGRNLPEVVCKT